MANETKKQPERPAETIPVGKAAAVANRILEKPKAVLLSKHHDISAFCSEDETRYVLGGAHYNAERKFLEATDGRQLIRVPVEESDEFPEVKTALDHPPLDCIIPRVALQKGLRSIPKSSLEILQHARLDANGKVSLTTFDLDNESALTTKPVEGNYPNTEQVIWTEEPTLTIALNPYYLKMIAEYASKHCHEKHTSIKLMFKSELEPMKWEVTLGNMQKATGLLMPMRLS